MGIVKTGAPAPEFTLAGMNGEQQSLQQLRGAGPVLLAFFKVSCPTCQYTFPFLERFHSKLAVVGISQNGGRETAAFNAEFGVGFPVLLDPADDGYPVSNGFRITHVPSLFLVEPDGTISLTSVGFLKADLEELARRFAVTPLFHKDERIEAFRAG